jgi:hypothetical protein
VDASPAQTAALEALAGVAAYSHKAPYSDAISDVYLGYDAAGKPCVAVALRSFKTYEKVTAMVVVREKDGAYVVDRADIPDAALIKNAEKRGKVTGAVKDITGKTVKSTTGEVSGIDAVTGATRYQARVYASFDLMARAALADLAANPEWPRTVLTPVAPAPTPDVSAQAPATGAP